MSLLSEDPPLAWLLAGLVLMVAELVLPGAYLIWLGLAAIGTGLLGLALAVGFAWQVAEFALLVAAALVVGVSRRRRRRVSSVNAPGSGLIGRTALALNFLGREGRVRLGDSDWAARLVEGAPQPADLDRLRVVDVEGTVLVVRPEMSEA